MRFSIRAIRSAAFYFIQKPFDREVLRTLVERCIELRWRREDHRQNLTRLETYGSPFVGWVKVTVDPAKSDLFSFEPTLFAGVPRSR